MTTFQRDLGSVLKDKSKERRGGPMGKKARDGELPAFTTNYRPAGRREAPNTLTPGSEMARRDNRYGTHEKDPPDPFGLGILGRL